MATGKKKLPSRRAPSDEGDVFSAAGGVPVVPRGLPGNDLRRTAVTELSWGDFDAHVQTLAAAARAKFKPQAVVGLVHGGIFMGGALASALGVEFYPLRVTSRHRESTRTVGDQVPAELKGRRVLLVDDICSTGDTLAFAGRLARAAGVTRLKTATLVARPRGFVPDFVAITAPDIFVFPWDYAHAVDDRRFDTGEHPARR